MLRFARLAHLAIARARQSPAARVLLAGSTAAAFALAATSDSASSAAAKALLALQPAHCDAAAPSGPAPTISWPPLYQPPASCGPMAVRMAEAVQQWQREIVEVMTAIDGRAFAIDQWGNEYRNGTSCVLENGLVFEKAAVNTTVSRLVKAPAERLKNLAHDHPQYAKMLARGAPVDLYTASVSLILHPWNPHAPTVHANYRYFELTNGHDEDRMFWFGGGADLTPAYVYEDDAAHFHRTLQAACQGAGGARAQQYYPKFKEWCDKYFYIKHRNEARGIGGVFFDDLHDESPEQIFSLVNSCASSFLPSYVPIIMKRKDIPYTAEQRKWQLLRRGRYVEFNLVYDKGTSYGLAQPGARVKSILVSLPATVQFAYDDDAAALPGTHEAATIAALKTPRDWAAAATAAKRAL